MGASKYPVTRHALLASACLVISSPVLAQTPPKTDVNGPASNPDAVPAQTASPNRVTPREGGLQEIIVTGRKKVENLQNIPIAESVVNQQTLAQYGVRSIENLSSLAPDLMISRGSSGNGASIAMRGISVNQTSISIEQSVATIIDGIYYNGGRALNEGLFDVAQVEVLKGPQTMFYGKNTTAGAISVTTADPSRTWTGMARAGYEFNAKQPYGEGYISGPINDTLSFRLAGRIENQYGALFRNVTQAQTVHTIDVASGAVTSHFVPKAPSNMPGQFNGIVRAGLKWEPTSRFTATVKATYNYFRINSSNSNQVDINCPNGVSQVDPSVACGKHFAVVQQGAPTDIAATNPYLNREGGQPFDIYKSATITENAQYRADKFTISLTSGYSWWNNSFLGDNDQSDVYPTSPQYGLLLGNSGAEVSRDRAYSTELRGQTNLGGWINFMVGGYYQKNKLYFNQDVIFPGGLENSAAVDPQTRYITVRKLGHTFDDTYSAFGQVIINISPKLNITSGVRYTHETKTSTFAQPYVNPALTSVFIPASVRTIGADQTFNNASPEATITWKPTAHITTYASYKTGYKSGGFSISGLVTANTSSADATFGIEKVKGFEGGIKSTLFDNQLRLNADIFTYKYTGLQVDFFDSALTQNLTLNAGSARTSGAELDAEFSPRAVPDLRLTGSISYTDAHYIKFPFAPCLAGQTIAQGCVTGETDKGTRASQNLNGNRTQQAPRWTGSAGVDYTYHLSNDLKLGLGVNGRYSSRYKLYAFASDATSRYFQKKFATLDASVRLGQVDDKWVVSVIGRNLTNTFIATSANDAPFTGSSSGGATGVPADVLGQIADPRTVALEATIKF